MPVASVAPQSTESFHEHLESLRHETQGALNRYLPQASAIPCRLHEAMRYVCMGGGKRVRAVLVYAAGETLGANIAALHAPASAVEMIHAYSLVHDDLPAMDNDDLRRGQPTCHKAYDEATALLVGDALQALAFDIISDPKNSQLNSEQKLNMCSALALASGSLGMAGGQAIDLASVGQQIDLTGLEAMHRLKTGALIRASVRLGALASPAPQESDFAALDLYASCIGLAFQIRDDVLDVEGNTETLGKQQGADQALNKPTYPALLGLDESKQKAKKLHEEALEALSEFDSRADFLRDLAGFIVSRIN